LHVRQGRKEGEQGDTIPRSLNHYGDAESPRGAESLRKRLKIPEMSQVANFLQYGMQYFLLKDLRFKHGTPNLLYVSGVISLR